MPLRQDNGGDAGVQVLTVSIVAGRNLKAMDIIGTSDPYCIVKVGRNKYQTRCYYETCHPVWREVAEFREPDLRDSLVVEVWDKDLTSDDMIGQVVIPLQQLVGFDMVAPRWYGLNDFDDEPVGEVLLRLKLPRPPGDGVGDKSTVQQVAWAEFELFQHGAKTSLKIGRTPRTTARLMTPEAAAAAGGGGGGRTLLCSAIGFNTPLDLSKSFGCLDGHMKIDALLFSTFTLYVVRSITKIIGGQEVEHFQPWPITSS